jgi:hypothetical protein
MAKFLFALAVVGLGVLVGVAIRQQLPDVQRYLRIRSM